MTVHSLGSSKLTVCYLHTLCGDPAEALAILRAQATPGMYSSVYEVSQSMASAWIIVRQVDRIVYKSLNANANHLVGR